MLPAWLGWGIAALGAVLALLGLAALAAASRDGRGVTGPFVAMAVAGGALVVAGLVTTAVRSLLIRRVLPASRYRGPSVFVLMGLGLVPTAVVNVAFARDAAAIFLGRGEPSLLGSLALLTIVQIGLLAVAGLFVVLPRALVGAPPLLARHPLRVVGLGLGIGSAGWLVATSLALFIALLWALAGLEPPVPPTEQLIAQVEPLIVGIAIVVVAPIAEETFFRGVMYSAWRREYGRRRALFGSAIVFGAVHLSPIHFLPLALLGVALGWLYERSQSLLAPIIAHAAFNAITLGLALFAAWRLGA
jgi:membrane protease YdiL (CAAX protease family)